MLISILQSLLLAASLCADCFAVAICSSVTMKKINWGSTLTVALAFGIVQAGLLAIGCWAGNLFIGLIYRVARIIGFLLLLYVGGSMIKESRQCECKARNLNGLRNVVISAVATSIDAFGVGISLSIGSTPLLTMKLDVMWTFILTVLSVVVGIFFGHKLGRRYGKVAELIGGIILILIGVNILFDLV